MQISAKWLVFLLLPACLYAQDDYKRHNITVGLGAGLPRDELRNLLSDSFGLGVSYGYRFTRLFQLDIGLDTIFGAADVRDFLETPFGDLRIRDYQFLVPMGGRVVVPLGTERVHFSAGGGGAYMRYSERLRQPFGDVGFTIDCPPCAARSGWGYYALVGGSVALDSNSHFRLGVESRIYRGETEGDPFGPIASFRTKDKWINVFGTFTFSF